MDEKGYIVTEEIWEEVEDEAPSAASTAPPAAKKPVLAGRSALIVLISATMKIVASKLPCRFVIQ